MLLRAMLLRATDALGVTGCGLALFCLGLFLLTPLAVLLLKGVGWMLVVDARHGARRDGSPAGGRGSVDLVAKPLTPAPENFRLRRISGSRPNSGERTRRAPFQLRKSASRLPPAARFAIEGEFRKELRITC